MIVISVEFLDDAGRILDDLLVSIGRVLSEWLNDATDSHLLQCSATLLVHAEVANGEESDAARRLRRTLIVRDNIKELLKSSVADQILAEGVRIANKVTQGSGGVCSRLLLLVFEEVDEEFDTWTEMLVQDLVMETSVTHSETSKLSSVAVWILAAGNRCLDQSMLQELLIEIARVTTQITDQVADFCPDASIIMADESVQVHIDVGIVDWLIELL